MIASDTTVAEAAKHLSTNDPLLAPVIARTGPCTIRPHKNYYKELVESILSQQLSIKAAASIERRFCELFPESDFPSPEAIVAKTIDELRTAGLSRGKATYVRDLARHVIDGKVRFDHLDTLSNDEIITELTAVKGIGEWTVHMFMMFCMGRMNILAYGDLGIKNGVQKLYDLDHQPTPQEIITVAEQNHWQPYESIACWYIWKSLDGS
jgi:DNA-3-methyladenine glycosylase II